jgi:sugar phosphate isomerase/epimerase
MLLGYNTNGLQNHRLEDGLRMLADHGYQAVAISLDIMHLDPFRVRSAEIDAIAGLCEQLGLQTVIETGARYLLDPRIKHEPTLMTRDTAARARRLDFYSRAAAIGRDLGAQVMSFWSGIDRHEDQDSWAWLCDGVTSACTSVREVGLTPALEPEPGMAIGRIADYERLREELGDGAPSLTLDIGHLYVNEAESPEALIARVVPHIAQVHLEDMRQGVHDHLVPGEGQVDFASTLQTLINTSFSGAVCFELSRSSHMAPDALKICAAVWRESVS